MNFAVKIYPVIENGAKRWKAQSEQYPDCCATADDPVLAFQSLEPLERRHMLAETDQLPEVNGKVIMYTDGACSGNPGPGGWGSILLFEDGSCLEFSGGELLTTNNRMELTAAVAGLQFLTLPHEVDIYSDSQYLVKTMNEGWKRNANHDLWEQLDAFADQHVLHFHWVKGHAEDTYNRRCDAMARAEAARQKQS